jgi:transcription antitermination factor NusG
MDDELKWFALRIKPRREQVVADALRAKGYEPFLPLHRERRRWSDRVTIVDTPLFPGYVFCRFDVTRRFPILATPGVMHVVSTAKTPDPIDDEEIDSVRVLVSSGLQVEPWPHLHIGRRVQIIAGPLAGARGILVSVKSQNRLVVSLTLLQRAVAVDMPESSVWPDSPDGSATL